MFAELINIQKIVWVNASCAKTTSLAVSSKSACIFFAMIHCVAINFWKFFSYTGSTGAREPKGHVHYLFSVLFLWSLVFESLQIKKNLKNEIIPAVLLAMDPHVSYHRGLKNSVSSLTNNGLSYTHPYERRWWRSRSSWIEGDERWRWHLWTTMIVLWACL